MKRFYTVTTTQKEGNGWAVLLDQRPVNTPLKNKLISPTQALADKIVLEWAGQKEVIDPKTMPLTQILSTKIDQIATQRDVMSAEILKYFNTDLLCYRADKPPELAARQSECWDIWLNWISDKFGTPLKTTTQIKAIEHSREAQEAVKNYVETLDDDHFNVLQLTTSLTGSIILALAFTEKEISAEDVFLATHIEEMFHAEIYDEEKYGPDPAQEKKDIAFKNDLEASALFLSLIDER